MSKENRLSKEERIQQIVQIAKTLFVQNGYSATSTAQIAREAGISEITLFRYFPTKRELFEAVIDPLIQNKRLLPADINMGSPAKSLILEMIQARFDFVKQERLLVRFIVIEAQLQPDLAGEHNPITNVCSQLIQLFHRLGISDETSQVVINLIMGVFLSVVFNPYSEEKIVDSAFEIVKGQIIKLLGKGEKS